MAIARIIDDSVYNSAGNTANAVSTGYQIEVPLEHFPEDADEINRQLNNVRRYHAGTAAETVLKKLLTAEKLIELWDTAGSTVHRTEALGLLREIISGFEREAANEPYLQGRWARAYLDISNMIVNDIYKGVTKDELNNLYGFSGDYEEAKEKALTFAFDNCHKAREVVFPNWEKETPEANIDLYSLGNSLVIEAKVRGLRRDPEDTDEEINKLLVKCVSKFSLESKVKEIVEDRPTGRLVTIKRSIEQRGSLLNEFASSENDILRIYTFEHDDSIVATKLGMKFLEISANLEQAKLKASSQETSDLNTALKMLNDVIDEISRFSGKNVPKDIHLNADGSQYEFLGKAIIINFMTKTNKYSYYDALITKADTLRLVGTRKRGNLSMGDLKTAYDIYISIDDAPEDGKCNIGDIKRRAIAGRIKVEIIFGRIKKVIEEGAVLLYVDPRVQGGTDLLASFPGYQYHKYDMLLTQIMLLVERNKNMSLYPTTNFRGMPGATAEGDQTKLKDTFIAQRKALTIINEAPLIKTFNTDGIKYLVNEAYFYYASAESLMAADERTIDRVQSALKLFDDILIRIEKSDSYKDRAELEKAVNNVADPKDRERIIKKIFDNVLNGSEIKYKGVDYYFFIKVFDERAKLYEQMVRLDVDEQKASGIKVKMDAEMKDKVDTMIGNYDMVIKLCKSEKTLSNYDMYIRPVNIELSKKQVELEFKAGDAEGIETEDAANEGLKKIDDLISQMDAVKLVLPGESLDIAQLYLAVYGDADKKIKPTIPLNKDGVTVTIGDSKIVFVKKSIEDLYFKKSATQAQLLAKKIFFIDAVPDTAFKPKHKAELILGQDGFFNKVVDSGVKALTGVYEENRFWIILNVIGASLASYKYDKVLVADKMETFFTEVERVLKAKKQITTDKTKEVADKSGLTPTDKNTLSWVYTVRANFKAWMFDNTGGTGNVKPLTDAIKLYDTALGLDKDNLPAKYGKANAELSIADTKFKRDLKTRRVPYKTAVNNLVAEYTLIAPTLKEIVKSKIDLSVAAQLKDEQKNRRQAEYEAAKTQSYQLMNSILRSLFDLLGENKVIITDLNDEDKAITADGYYLENRVEVNDVINASLLNHVNKLRAAQTDSTGDLVFADANAAQIGFVPLSNATLDIDKANEIINSMGIKGIKDAGDIFALLKNNYVSSSDTARALQDGTNGAALTDKEMVDMGINPDKLYEDYSGSIASIYLSDPTPENRTNMDNALKASSSKEEKLFGRGMKRWSSRVTGWEAMSSNNIGQMEKAASIYEELDKVKDPLTQQEGLDNSMLKDYGELLTVVYYRSPSRANYLKATGTLIRLADKDRSKLGSEADMLLSGFIMSVAAKAPLKSLILKRYKEARAHAISSLGKQFNMTKEQIDGLTASNTDVAADLIKALGKQLNMTKEQTDQLVASKPDVADIFIQLTTEDEDLKGDRVVIQALSYLAMSEGYIYSLGDAKEMVGEIVPIQADAARDDYGLLLKASAKGELHMSKAYLKTMKNLNAVITLGTEAGFGTDKYSRQLFSKKSASGISAVKRLVQRSYGISEVGRDSALREDQGDDGELKYFFEKVE
jgi:hypothetical protein